MKAVIHPTAEKASGRINAISSKSVAHRLLICAAFADAPTRIRCDCVSRDIEATVDCLVALGADISRDAPYYFVKPITKINKNAKLNCHESGSTLRLLLPITAALGADSDFYMAGRLPERPLSPLREELEAHGIEISKAGSNPLTVRGRLSGRDFSIAGNVSSQFVSGLLFALTLRGEEATLTVEGNIESVPYIEMTSDALAIFSAEPEISGNVYKIKKGARLISPSDIEVEGDWSNAAFPLSAGAISYGADGVTVSGLNIHSHQGDREILKLLEDFGAEVSIADSGDVTVKRRVLRGIEIDATNIPDLVPILAIVASVAEGETKICGAARLRIKESDRLRTVTELLTALGADVTELEDGLIIKGRPQLLGGSISSSNDHRIAMSAAVASIVCKESITINGADAVNKSYPSFWQDVRNIKIYSDIS